MLIFGVLQEHQLAAIITFLISLFGSLCNWFLAIFIYRLRSMSNPFGLLRDSQAIGEAVHLTVFTTYFVPMTFFDLEVLRENSRFAGIVLIICFEIALYTHCLISLNRFCAINFALEYNKIFT
ncbi:hypothetical protein NECAME_16194 [Necator americanus]|uniref:7TM GPCR serpentine receptor class x (Srx) domain-containing protein n=1 Tax=Necator americanus TaxID=51031 RepID=W2TX88_NECAM|nr:hypothetical protein NECAME_16194 [Necator americanus]ETN86705.1 hypothetical protein NECAME_16194 [Necator americanus]